MKILQPQKSFLLSYTDNYDIVVDHINKVYMIVDSTNHNFVCDYDYKSIKLLATTVIIVKIVQKVTSVVSGVIENIFEQSKTFYFE